MYNFCVEKCKPQIEINDKYMKKNNLTIIQTPISTYMRLIEPLSEPLFLIHCRI